jgi:hypothetical protein
MPTPARTPVGRLSRELRGLMVYNKDPESAEETVEVAILSQAFSGETFYGETTFISGFDDKSDKLKTFAEVSGHKNQKEWWEAMCTEFDYMESNEV